MLDWNWRVLKNLVVYALVVAAMCTFAVFTATVEHAVAGALVALLVQVALYAIGTSRQVGQSFELMEPLHRMVRWDNTFFRMMKGLTEFLLIAGMGYVAYAHLQGWQIVSFVAFGIFFTGAPTPLLAWAYYRKVLRHSRATMNRPRHAATAASKVSKVSKVAVVTVPAQLSRTTPAKQLPSPSGSQSRIGSRPQQTPLGDDSVF
ncbi:MAG: hypothetical protein V4795_18850 [Pseudomonadota bacterium]